MELSKRHRDALEGLSRECAYEDSRPHGYDQVFVAAGRFSGGEKTISDLLAWGLIVTGRNEWDGSKGYRITEAGQADRCCTSKLQPDQISSRLNASSPQMCRVRNQT